MDVSISNTPQGYVVSAYYRARGENCHGWHKLRNFGNRQGDAIEYRDFDVPRMSEASLHLTAKNYNPDVRYRREANHRGEIIYRKQ